ncbi:MAG: galactokinase [Acidobacteria bacterium]|nr:galactokinase [Acidobacteriota bacterium]MBI3261549.1 galactokinase [Acidobacteriota bacterium]
MAASSDAGADLASRFVSLFAETPRIYRAPGRVNLIGEHTDYNEGFVLPAALTMACWVAGSPRPDAKLIVHSENFNERITGPGGARAGGWADYVRGVALALKAAGHQVSGATLLVRGDVPMGAGLGSSASLEVAVASALLDLSGVRMDPIELARICQRAENEFVGARCGIMDQFVACHARAGTALRLDCRSLEYGLVPVPPYVRLVACNTMVRHRLAEGEYNRRRAECEASVLRVASITPGMRSLRDVDPAWLDAHGHEIPDRLLRRARHVVTENVRVLEAAEALGRHDLGAVGVLMADSHRSLRDDFEVSCPELDLMTDLARAVPGVFGARMTGGGFGGSTVNLVHEDAVDELCRHVATKYERETGRRPDIYATQAGDGAGRVMVES